MSGKYVVATLGCKVNQYESQEIREVLESCGFKPARPGERADIAVVNSCAVTSIASRKSRQTVRRLSRGGRTPIVVVGCAATADGPQLRNLPGVCAVLGHDRNVSSELRNLLAGQLGFQPTCNAPNARSAILVKHDGPDAPGNDEIMRPHAAWHEQPSGTSHNAAILDRSLSLPLVKDEHVLTGRIDAFAGHQRAFLKVQDGCDAFCTYCIIPRLRPPPRSKPIDVVVAEARDLVRAGHKEITVTGIFLGAYGRETAIRRRWAPGRSPLAGLVAALAQVEGLARLRLSSLEPGDVDDALLEVLSTHKACVPHLHLPLQSGSPEILRRMNRQYAVGDFLAMVERVRTVLDQPAMTTDIIVGFPGESEANFEASLEIARAAEFCKIHAFPFSPRQGTAAARWKDESVHPQTVRERMRRLADVERDCSLAFRRHVVGRLERVIVEAVEGNGDGPLEPDMFHGRADRYFQVHFAAPNGSDGCNHRVRPGDLVSVRIDRVTPTRTHAALLDSGSTSLQLPVLPFPIP